MRIIKQLVFVLFYVLVLACVNYTLTTALNAPIWVPMVVAVIWVLLANRVGAGFGFKIDWNSREDTDGGSSPLRKKIEIIVFATTLLPVMVANWFVVQATGQFWLIIVISMAYMASANWLASVLTTRAVTKTKHRQLQHTAP